MISIFSRKFAIAFIFTALIGTLTSTSNQASIPTERYRAFIQVKSPAELRRAATWLTRAGYDVAGVSYPRNTIEVLTNEAGVQNIRSRAVISRLVKAPVVGGKIGPLSGLDQRYLNPARVAARLNALHDRFPTVTRVIEIGRSLKDIPILAMVISTTPDLNDPKFGTKPTVLFDGMHHAREVMTPEIVLDIGETLLASAARVKRARAILASTNIVLVPMLNVDGNSRVWEVDNMWRKNARSEGNVTFGVDLNRNYPYRWADCNGSSSSRDSQTYHGASATSEPETKALVGLAERIRPTAAISYHSFSELVLYPFGCGGEITGENALLEKLGNELAKLLPNDTGGGHYTAGHPWELLYPVDGDSMNFLFAAFGAVAYTVEVNEEFQPPYELRDPTVKKQRSAWQYLLEQVQTRLLTVEVRDASGKPVAANIDIAQIPHSHGERDFRSNEAGNYFKVLLPGTYSIRARLKNGRAVVAQVIMGDQPQKITLVAE